MADTTKANVLKIAPELSGVSDDLWTLALADAATLINEDNVTNTDLQEIIQRYKVAHDLTVLSDVDKAGGSISSQEMGDALRDYKHGNYGLEYDRTSYGTIFKKYWYRTRKMVIL